MNTLRLFLLFITFLPLGLGSKTALAGQHERHGSRVLLYEEWSGNHLLVNWSDSLGEVSLQFCSKTGKGTQICEPITPYGYKIQDLQTHTPLLVKALLDLEFELSQQQQGLRQRLLGASHRKDLNTLKGVTRSIHEAGAESWLASQLERNHTSTAFSRPLTLDKVKIAMEKVFTHPLPEDTAPQPEIYDYETIEMASGF